MAGAFTHDHPCLTQGAEAPLICSPDGWDRKKGVMPNHVTDFKVSTWKWLVYLHSLAIQTNPIWLTWFTTFTTKSLEGGRIHEYLLKHILGFFQRKRTNRYTYTYICAYICIHTHIHIYMCIYMYTYTYKYVLYIYYMGM